MTDNNNLAAVRTYLEDQSAIYLVDLLIDLVQAIDEPTRQRFWDRLAPSNIATADLRYSSPELFLTELQEFAEAVSEGKFFDEEALEYFGEDPFDREYNRGKYGYYQDFDPDEHEGLNALSEFLTEADSYFQVEQYNVAAAAYEIIIGIVAYSPEESLGIYDPLSELGEYEELLGQRYFIALKESHTPTEFYDKAIQYLARHDQPYRKHTENFMTLVGSSGQANVQAFLEQWANGLAHQPIAPSPAEVPYQLRLLIRFYKEANQQSNIVALQKRFRHIYLTLYDPLLTDREAAKDWLAVIDYGQEVLSAIPSAAVTHHYLSNFSHVNTDKVRTQMARAYEEIEEIENAIQIYQPLFEQQKNFEHYMRLKQLIAAAHPRQADTFTTTLITELKSQLPHSLYFLCQIFLNANQFDNAYDLAKQQSRYNSLATIKLVAKAHLLAGLGPKATTNMGTYLQDLYTKVERAENEPTLFLRDHLPLAPALEPKTAVAHAESLYQNVMQMHIDNGRKTYATAAYYCALLGDIAAYTERAIEFKQFYQQLLDRYPRHRALHRELAAKIEKD